MDTRTSIFVVALFSLLVAIGWATSEHGMCDYKLIENVLKEHTKDGAVSCFDFWFNRYQTLLGVLVALGAAWFTWQGVKSQIAAATQQRAASLIDIVSRRYEATKSIERSMIVMYRTVNQLNRTVNIVISQGIDVKNAEELDDKQSIYNEFFYRDAKNFVTLSNTFHNRRTNIRNNLQPALLVPSVRNDVEDFIAVTRPIERAYLTLSSRIQTAIETEDWDEFDRAIERAIKNYTTVTDIDLKSHRGQAAIKIATYDLSQLLDDILISAHKI